MEFLIFIILIVLSHLVGVYAKKRGRSYWGHTLSSLFLSPLIGFLIVIALPVSEDGLLNSGNFKMCPHCAETVKKQALICKHCKKDIV